jgi:hypothetical protein
MNGFLKVALAMVALFLMSGLVMASEKTSDVIMYGTVVAPTFEFIGPAFASGNILSPVDKAQLANGEQAFQGISSTPMYFKVLGDCTIFVKSDSANGKMYDPSNWNELSNQFFVWLPYSGGQWKAITTSNEVFDFEHSTDDTTWKSRDVSYAQKLMLTDTAGNYQIQLTFTAQAPY